MDNFVPNPAANRETAKDIKSVSVAEEFDRRNVETSADLGRLNLQIGILTVTTKDEGIKGNLLFRDDEGDVIGSVTKGDKVEFLGKIRKTLDVKGSRKDEEHTWFQVKRSDGKVGWVSAEYLTGKVSDSAKKKKVATVKKQKSVPVVKIAKIVQPTSVKSKKEIVPPVVKEAPAKQKPERVSKPVGTKEEVVKEESKAVVLEQKDKTEVAKTVLKVKKVPVPSLIEKEKIDMSFLNESPALFESVSLPVSDFGKISIPFEVPQYDLDKELQTYLDEILSRQEPLPISSVPLELEEEVSVIEKKEIPVSDKQEISLEETSVVNFIKKIKKEGEEGPTVQKMKKQEAIRKKAEALEKQKQEAELKREQEKLAKEKILEKKSKEVAKQKALEAEKAERESAIVYEKKSETLTHVIHPTEVKRFYYSGTGGVSRADVGESLIQMQWNSDEDLSSIDGPKYQNITATYDQKDIKFRDQTQNALMPFKVIHGFMYNHKIKIMPGMDILLTAQRDDPNNPKIPKIGTPKKVHFYSTKIIFLDPQLKKSGDT